MAEKINRIISLIKFLKRVAEKTTRIISLMKFLKRVADMIISIILRRMRPEKGNNTKEKKDI